MSDDINNLFIYATRNKLRFASARGELTVEQLWDVPLRGANGDFNLDAIAKLANRSLKEGTEESFVTLERTQKHQRLEFTLEIVKHVIYVKLAEEARAKNRAENKLKREKLLSILAEKQEGKLSKMSEAELKRQIEALED